MIIVNNYADLIVQLKKTAPKKSGAAELPEG